MRLGMLLLWLGACGADGAPAVGAVDGAVEAVDGAAGGPDAGPVVHRVVVNADGTFSPAEVVARGGDTVEWQLHDRHDSVVPTVANCVAAPFVAGAVNRPLGPLPEAPSGIFVLGPLSGETRAATWSSPGVAGVFVRMLWSELAPAPGDGDASYDFARLDAALDAAVAAGKLVSLGIKAGDDGTPDWIFSTERDGTPRAGGGGGVTRLALQDAGSDPAGCGVRMFLGSPTDPAYQALYLAMLRKVAAHLRTRADWWRTVAVVKPSGANLFSHENRLPKRCDPGCVCNPRVFAEAGYTPSGLTGFYRAQLALLAAEFPGKSLSFALIQDGWPQVNDAGDYETEDGSSSGGMLVTGIRQTQALLDLGQAEHGARFLVQHNGLGPHPTPEVCSSYDQHPAMPPFGGDGPCPNRWVLGEGGEGQITGFQTSNESRVASFADLELTFENLKHNSDGVFFEIYEERLIEAEAAGETGALVAWGEELHARRRDVWPGATVADPYPMTVRLAVAPGDEVVTYANPWRCDENPAAVGRIVVRP